MDQNLESNKFTAAQVCFLKYTLLIINCSCTATHEALVGAVACSGSLTMLDSSYQPLVNQHLTTKNAKMMQRARGGTQTLLGSFNLLENVVKQAKLPANFASFLCYEYAIHNSFRHWCKSWWLFQFLSRSTCHCNTWCMTVWENTSNEVK